MEHPIGTYTTEIVWLPEHNAVGVWRFECKRCGLVVQTKRGESSDRCEAATRHVCDPSKKDGMPAFDPSAPFTDSEKLRATLDGINKALKPNAFAHFLDHEAGQHKDAKHPECLHRGCQ